MSATFLGEKLPERLTCGDEHLPGCYNPPLDTTWCMCGKRTWPGRIGVWKSISRYAPAGPLPALGIGIGALGQRDTAVVGYDTYFLHADHCTERETPCATGCEVRP